MRVEVWVSSPEPAVGVSSSAAIGFWGGAWDRTGRGRVAGSRPGDGGGTRASRCRQPGATLGATGINNLLLLRTRMDNAN
jgi:hypothetical protein